MRMQSGRIRASNTRHMTRRILRSFAGIMAALVLLIAGEVLIVMRKDFIRADPEEPIQGVFGDPNLPALRFAVLGDSTSVGLGTVQEASFPWRLATRLGEHLHVDLKVFGKSGAQSLDVATDQVPRAIAWKPDLALIEIGANDATHATPVRSVRAQVGAAVKDLKAAGIDVVVVGPPAMGTSRVFPQPIRALSGFNGRRVERAIKSVASAESVPYIELASRTQQAFRDEPEKHYSSDGFHPGGPGYELWARVMYPGVLEAALRAAH